MEEVGLVLGGGGEVVPRGLEQQLALASDLLLHNGTHQPALLRSSSSLLISLILVEAD